MGLRAWASGLLGLAIVAGCGGRDEALQGRMQALEQRLAAVDQRLAVIDKDLPTGERLRNDLRTLEQRLGAVEAKATEALELAKAPPPPPPPAATTPGRRRDAGSSGQGPDRTERRAQLGALMSEYRRRLDEVKRQNPGASPAEQMAARREVRDWYIARRRAILTGQPLPD